MKTPSLLWAALLFAAAIILAYLLLANSLYLGQQSLLARAVLFPAPALAALAGGAVLLRPHAPRAARLLVLSCALAQLGGFGYFLYWLPRYADSALSIALLDQTLIAESSSGAFVEIGFGYPVFTPAVELRNGELFSREIDAYLRMVDSGGQAMLYRAVREQAPAGTLSVEASMRGMLGANSRYLFLPLRLAPGETISGRLVFIIAALDNGASFASELRRAESAQLELRDARDGKLLLTAPVTLQG